MSPQVPDRGRNWGLHRIGVPRQEDSERGASWRVQVVELKWLTLNIIFSPFLLREPGDGSTLLQKTHHNSLVVLYVTQILRYSAFLQVRQPKVTQTLLWRMRHIKFFGGRGVVIVRNPYKALISYWNHQVSDFLNLNGKMIPTHMCLLNLNPSLSILLRLVPPPEEWRSHGPGPTSQFHGLRF